MLTFSSRRTACLPPSFISFQSFPNHMPFQNVRLLTRTFSPPSHLERVLRDCMIAILKGFVDFASIFSMAEFILETNYPSRRIIRLRWIIRL